jgi:sn-glycerol 3-phosphate transport system permease protein
MAATAEPRSYPIAAPRPRPRRRSPGRLLWRTVGYATMALIAALIVVPLLWMVSAAFKTTPEIYRTPITFIPESLRWSNFAEAWRAVPFDRFYVNSLLVTAVVAGVKVVNSVLSAYALVFMRFPGRRLLFLFVLAALMVPHEVTIVPNYLLMADAGWVNTYAGIILPLLAVAFGTFLLRQHFLSLPREMIEAARIDGAGHPRILWSVVLPVSRPVIVTVALIYVVGSWNEYLWPLIITNALEMRTLPIGLKYLRDTEGNTQWGVIMAGTVMVVAPVLGFFLWTQRHLIRGLTSGSVKG